jgi:two-component system, NarL family, response regulator YdfI
MTLKTAAARGVSVLIFAQSTERRLALRAMLSQEPDISLIDVSASDLNAALRQARPGVVVVDLDGDLATSVETLSESGAAVVLLADNPETNWVVELLTSRPSAVLRRNCSQRQLAAAVQAASAGLIVLELDTIQGLLRPPLDTIELEPGDEELTPRETEVLRMMTAGLSNREIASTLGISEHTVKFHIASIFGKLGTSSRTQAVTEGIRRGLVLL